MIVRHDCSAALRRTVLRNRERASRLDGPEYTASWLLGELGITAPSTLSLLFPAQQDRRRRRAPISNNFAFPFDLKIEGLCGG